MAVQKRYAALFVLAGLLIVGSIWGYFRWQHSIIYVKTENAYVKGDIYTASFKTPGKIARIEVKENALVKKGELIAVLEPEDYDIAIKNTEGKASESAAGVSTSRAQISQAESAIKVIQSQLELALIERKRAENLYQKESISKQKYDQALTSEKVLEAQLDAAKKALITAGAGLEVSEGKAKTAEASLESAKRTRTYCELYSPETGFVTRKSAEPGQVVQAGQPVCAIVPLSGESVWIEANYKETQLGRVKTGQTAKFWSDIDKSAVFEGEVESLSPGTGVVFSLFPAENATGNWVKVVQRVPVKIRIKPGQNSADKLRLGLSVTCVIDTTGK
jgi:membrane fusion protein, multidrug efflux system